MVRKRRLGKSLGILLNAAEKGIDFGPTWAIVGRAERARLARFRFERRRALHAAGVRNMRLLRRAMRRAMGNDAWVYRHFGVVPY